MKMLSRWLLTGACILALSCTYAEQDEANSSGDEIIMKFAEGQAVNETIRLAFNDADAEASLKVYVRHLSEELGVPFVYSRLTSGREIVIEIRGNADAPDAEQLVRTLVEDLASRPDIEYAQSNYKVRHFPKKQP